MKLRKKYNKKDPKKIVIKRLKTKFDIKIIWNNMLRDENIKKIN